MISAKFTSNRFFKKVKSVFITILHWLIGLPGRFWSWIKRYKKPIIISIVSVFTVVAILFATSYVPYKKYAPTFPSGNIFDDDFKAYFLCDWLEKPSDVVNEKIEKNSYTCYTNSPLTDYFLSIVNNFKNGHKIKYVLGRRGDLFNTYNFNVCDDEYLLNQWALYEPYQVGVGDNAYQSYKLELLYTNTFIKAFHFDLGGIGWVRRANWVRSVRITAGIEPCQNGLYETRITFGYESNDRCGRVVMGNPYTNENRNDTVVIYG